MAVRKGRPGVFIVVGCMAALVHLAIVFLLVDHAGTSPALANVPAFLCAFCVSHAGHHRFSFPSLDACAHSRWRWLQVSVAAFLLNQSLTSLALHAFPQVWYLLVIACVSAGLALVSYSLGKTWAFST